MLAGAKGAVRWSAAAMRRRSGVAGESSAKKARPWPAPARAAYTASCAHSVPRSETCPRYRCAVPCAQCAVGMCNPPFFEVLCCKRWGWQVLCHRSPVM